MDDVIDSAPHQMSGQGCDNLNDVASTTTDVNSNYKEKEHFVDLVVASF